MKTQTWAESCSTSPKCLPSWKRGTSCWNEQLQFALENRHQWLEGVNGMCHLTMTLDLVKCSRAVQKTLLHRRRSKITSQSNPVIFIGCYFSNSHLVQNKDEDFALWIWMDTAAMSGYNFEGLGACGTFILNKKTKEALEGSWKKDDNGLMVPLHLPC